MIPHNELRIGNWINCHFQTTNFNAQVLEIRHGGVVVQDGDHKNSYSYDNISPIPLTHERLESAGFELLKTTYIKKESPFVLQKEFLKNGYWIAAPTLTHLSNFEHLHQLQNLYFALTGEELTIKNLTV